LDREFRISCAVVENGLWHSFRVIQCRDGIHGAVDVVAAGALQSKTARRDAAIGLRHLSRALHVHHLAAIFRLRSGVSRRSQSCDRVYRHTIRKLDTYAAVAQDSGGSADDLGRVLKISEGPLRPKSDQDHAAVQ